MKAKPSLRSCTVCGAALSGKQHKLCSATCAATWRKSPAGISARAMIRAVSPAAVQRVCEMCNAPFVGRLSGAPVCSATCKAARDKLLGAARYVKKEERRRAHRKANPIDFVYRRGRQCAACGTTFMHPTVARRACSAACGNILSHLTRTANAKISKAARPCVRCGTVFAPKNIGGAVYRGASAPPSFCSRACANAARSRQHQAAGGAS